MNTDVIIKANSHGIRIILSNDYPLDRSVEEIKARLYKYDSLLKKSGNIYVSFEGRVLSREEIDTILYELNNLPETGINFIYKCEESKPEPDITHHKKNNIKTIKKTKPSGSAKETKKDSGTLFFRGNLQNGQVLETNKSIIIIGNVAKRAKVISNGNIIIIGNLKGEATAGKDCSPKRFVLALQMEPVHIKIGMTGGSFHTSCHKKFNTNDAVIAYCENGQLVFNLLSQTSL